MGEEEFVRQRISEAAYENIEFSRHAADNFRIRNFSGEAVFKILKTNKILRIEKQEDPRPGKKYKLWIEKSHRYNFIIVINIPNGKIRIVTFHLESAKRMQRLRKWLKEK